MHKANHELYQDKIDGVLGGMGPEATVDFMSKVIARTNAINASHGKAGADLRNDDSHLISGDELRAAPHSSGFFLAVVLVAGLQEYVEGPAGPLAASDADHFS